MNPAGICREILFSHNLNMTEVNPEETTEETVVAPTTEATPEQK